MKFVREKLRGCLGFLVIDCHTPRTVIALVGRDIAIGLRERFPRCEDSETVNRTDRDPN